MSLKSSPENQLNWHTETNNRGQGGGGGDRRELKHAVFNQVSYSAIKFYQYTRLLY